MSTSNRFVHFILAMTFVLGLGVSAVYALQVIAPGQYTRNGTGGVGAHGVTPTTVSPITRPPAKAVIRNIPAAGRKAAVLAQLPDLVIGRLYVTPSMIHAGDRISLRVRVSNHSTMAIRGIKVRFLNRQNRRVLGEKTLNLAAGAFAVSQLRTTLVGNGRVDIAAILDPNQRVAERNEKNNMAQLQLSVTPAKTSTARVITAVHPPAVRNHPVPRSRQLRGVPGLFQKQRAKLATVTPKVRIRKSPHLSTTVPQFGPRVPPRQTRGFGKNNPQFHAFGATSASAAAAATRNTSIAQKMTRLPLHRPALVFGSKLKLRGRIGKSSQTHEISSTPAPLIAMSALPRSNPKAVDVVGHVRSDSGVRIGSAQSSTVPRTQLQLRVALPSGNSVPFSGQVSMVVSPKQGDTWLSNKSYQLQWTLSDSQTDVKTIELWNISTKVKEKDQKVLSIAPVVAKKQGDVFSMPFTIPTKLKAGSYFFRMQGVANINGKNQAYAIDSGVFIIAWGLTAGNYQTAIVEAPFQIEYTYAKDRPMISFFSYDKNVTKCNGLNIRFYWQDEGQNLYGGIWTFEWQSPTKGWLKKTGPIAGLPMPDEFKDKQGMVLANIPLCEYKNSAVPFSFYLKDSSKLVSNKVYGVMNSGHSPHTLADFAKTASPSGKVDVSPLAKKSADVATPVTFITPPLNKIGWYIRGASIDIKYQLNKVPVSVKTIPITLDLVRLPGNVIVKKIQTTKVPNNGQPYMTSWKIPQSLPLGYYYFKASTSKLTNSAKSGRFITVSKGVITTSPIKDSVYKVWDTVVIKWKSMGISSPGMMNLEFHAINAAKHLRLNKTPVPIKSGTYSWKITPGSVPNGEGYITLYDADSTGTILGYTQYFNITYPQQGAPSLVFTTPKPQQSAKWLPGTLEEVAWKVQGQFLGAIPLALTLENLDTGKIYPIGKTAINSGIPGKYLVNIPANQSPGLYHILAQSPTLGLLGTSPPIEIVGSNMPGPAYNTQFAITKVDYPISGGAVTVHVQVNTPKSFRFNGLYPPHWGSQYLAYRIANFRDKATPEVVVVGDISVKKNPSLFPKHVFPKGQSDYVITFTPTFTKPLKVFAKVTQFPSGPFEAGSMCMTFYHPKLELVLTTTTNTENIAARVQKYLLDTSEEASWCRPGTMKQW